MKYQFTENSSWISFSTNESITILFIGTDWQGYTKFGLALYKEGIRKPNTIMSQAEIEETWPDLMPAMT